MQTEPAHSMHVIRLSVMAAFGCFALFLVLILFVRQSGPSAAQPSLADISEGDRWKYTPEGRAAKLTEIHAAEQAKSATYDWVDQGNGVVRLPLERAMELTVQDINAKR